MLCSYDGFSHEIVAVLFVFIFFSGLHLYVICGLHLYAVT
jgi:hypothetical protein